MPGLQQRRSRAHRCDDVLSAIDAVLSECGLNDPPLSAFTRRAPTAHDTTMRRDTPSPS